MSDRVSVIYIGDLVPGATCIQRLQAMRDLGHDVFSIDLFPNDTRAKLRSTTERLRRKFFGLRDLGGANKALLKAADSKRPDMIWIDRGLVIEPATLSALRNMSPRPLIVGYSPDDMCNPANQSRQFLGGLSLYDVYFTTKSFGVSELKALGCPRVEFIANAYDPATHRPVELSPQEREELGAPVGFVGTAEEDRAGKVQFLADQGISVKVWGDKWRQLIPKDRVNLKVSGASQYADQYAKIINAFDINLCFLRKANRDLQTQRSVEIPACGAFMLAERTDEHAALFVEGKEAEFFSSEQELLQKVQFYLAHPEERKAIAASGRQRCLNSGYSNEARMGQMFSGLLAMRESCRAASTA